MKKILLLMLSLSSLFGCKSQTKDTDSTIQVLDVVAFKNGIAKKDIQLVDVRTPKEYNQGYIKSAKNIDYFSDYFKTEAQKLDKEKPLYIYCRSGRRSGKASKIIKALGFKEIYDLKGGYLAWSKQ